MLSMHMASRGGPGARYAAAADRYDWRDDAACAGLPPTWFDVGKAVHNQRALSYCDTCPVRRTCRDWLLETPGQYSPSGIIGGGWVWGKNALVLRVHNSDLRAYRTILAAAQARRRALGHYASWWSS